MLQRLIGAGADLNTGDKIRATPLFYAVLGGCDGEMIEILLKAGADVDARTVYGHTALMTAAAFGRREVVRLLMEAGADVQARTELGKTVLNGAVGPVDDPEIIEALIAAGADVNAKDNVGWTPLLAAAQSTEHPENIELLLAAGVDATAKSYEGKTAFDYAQENPALWDTEAFWMLNDARF